MVNKRLKPVVLNCSEIMNVEEVSQVLRIPLKTVRRHLHSGKLPGKKVGRHWRITKQDLEQYMRS